MWKWAGWVWSPRHRCGAERLGFWFRVAAWMGGIVDFAGKSKFIVRLLVL